MIPSVPPGSTRLKKHEEVAAFLEARKEEYVHKLAAPAPRNALTPLEEERPTAMADDAAVVRARESLIATGLLVTSPEGIDLVRSGQLDHVYPMQVALHALQTLAVPIEELRHQLPAKPAAKLVKYREEPRWDCAWLVRFYKAAMKLVFRRNRYRNKLMSLRDDARKWRSRARAAEKKACRLESYAKGREQEFRDKWAELGFDPDGYSVLECRMCGIELHHAKTVLPHFICPKCSRERNMTNDDSQRFNRYYIEKQGYLRRDAVSPHRYEVWQHAVQRGLTEEELRDGVATITPVVEPHPIMARIEESTRHSFGFSSHESRKLYEEIEEAKKNRKDLRF